MPYGFLFLFNFSARFLNRQTQLSVHLHLLPRNSGHMKIIWEDTIQSKSMHTKCKEKLPPKRILHDLRCMATSLNKPTADIVCYKAWFS